MAIHIDNMENVPNPNTQSPSVFESKVTNLLNSDLPTFITQTNSLSDDLSAKWDETHTFRNDAESFKNSAYSYMNTTLSYRNDANNYKSLAYGYKVAAEDAANRAESVVIPTEATYSLNDLESALNSLLTYQVAQAAQISILKQGA